MRIEFHPAALRELIDSARFYENRLPGLGVDFVAEVNGTLDRLNDNPEVGAAVDAPCRRVLLDRFPFAVIYRVKDATIRILAVAHQRRRPGYWQSRT